VRTVLKGVHGISAKEDKPSTSSPSLTMWNQPLTWAQVEQNLLYYYLPELKSHKSHRSSTDPLDSTCAKHLDLLIQHLRATYINIITRLLPLLIGGEITYNLLWGKATGPKRTKEEQRNSRTINQPSNQRTLLKMSASYETVELLRFDCRYQCLSLSTQSLLHIEILTPRTRRARCHSIKLKYYKIQRFYMAIILLAAQHLTTGIIL